MKALTLVPSFLRIPKKGYFYIKADGTVEVIQSRRLAFTARMRDNIRSLKAIFSTPLS